MQWIRPRILSDHGYYLTQSYEGTGRYSEGSRKLRFPDYVIMAQNGGKVVSLTHRPFLPPGNTPGIHFS